MSVNDKYILVIGCFDTKEEVFSYLRQLIVEQGEKVITVDTGVMGSTSAFPVDHKAEEVAQEGGVSLQDLRNKADRGYAVDIMGKGAAKIVSRLVGKNLLKAAISMGGGGGTYITLQAMQEIPISIPKLCLSTLATRDLSRQMGVKNITLMPSVVDVAGLNSVSQVLIEQAAASICAMSNVQVSQSGRQKQGSIAISMFGNTTACVDYCTALLKKEGYEVLAFHATGIGGRTMETLIREGYFDAVLDITTTELADELCGGILSAGPYRLSAACDLGIPQVVVPGCLDMVNFAQQDTVPAKYQNRKLYSWAPDVTLMRTNKAENEELGKLLANKLNRTTNSAAVMLPLRGISQVDAEGDIFYDPEADEALFSAIKEYCSDKVSVVEVDVHINDEAFARESVDLLLKMLEKSKATT